MIVSIDYDKTYTADPESFNKIIEILLQAGHEVICVTLRPAIMGQEVLDSIGQIIGEDHCIFTHGEWKNDVAKESGFKVDIWIDDTPSTIQNILVLK